MHFDLKLWRLTQGLRGRIAFSVALGLLALAVGIARFAFLGLFLAGVFHGEPVPALLGPLAGTAGAILLRGWLDHARTMIAHRTALRVQETLRTQLYDKIVALGPAWFGAERTGGVMLSMVDGVEQLQTFFGQYLPQVTIALFAPIAIFAFIAWWDVPVASIMLAAALFTLVLPSAVHRKTGQASRARQSAFKSFGEEFLDAVQGLPTLKAFGQSASYGRMLADKARALSQSTLWVLALNVTTRGFTDLGTALGAAAALSVGAWRVSEGSMSLEALLIVLMAGTEIFRPLRDLRTVLHQGMNGQSAAAGINALLDAPITAPQAATAPVPSPSRTSASSSPALPASSSAAPLSSSSGAPLSSSSAALPASSAAAPLSSSSGLARGSIAAPAGGVGDPRVKPEDDERRAAEDDAGGAAEDDAGREGEDDAGGAAEDDAGRAGEDDAEARDTSLALVPSIDFDAVGFAYPGGRRAAHRALSFSVAAGERVGIVGPSGSGKSSIVRLLLRLHDPQQGTIRIGGRDLRTLDPDAVRRMIAVVAQDTYLFHGTVEENLRLGSPDATEAELVAAARSANAHDFIMALPDGYQTVIGERGARLSGGQRQRLAIARALLRDAPILVLDEALSSVDAENEAVIQQALDRLMAGRTTLILAHRLSSVIGADRILVLEDGAVVQSGRHAELIAQEGAYRRLMLPQMEEGSARDADLIAAMPEAPQQDAERERGTVIRSLAEDAAKVTWPETIRTLMQIVRPYRAQLWITVLCGIGRVLAFISVGVFGALLLGAVRENAPGATLTVALLIAAPVAGLLHWLESWIAHAMAYALLAEMRIDLFRKLDALAPAYLLQRRSGDLVALATQDVETVEYFFAHTIAPAIVAGLVPAGVLAALLWLSWPLALALAPFLFYAGASPIYGRERIDTLASQARGALAAMSAHVTETIQGLAELQAFNATGRRRAGFQATVRQYQAMRLRLLADLTLQTSLLEIATGLGGLAVAVAGAVLVAQATLPPAILPLVVLISIAAFLPVSEIAQVGRQLADTISSTRRLHVVHAEPVVITDGPLEPAAPAGGSTVAFQNVRFTYPGRSQPALSDVSFQVPAGATVALVGPSGAGKTTIANLLLRFWDPEAGTIRLDGVDLRQLTLDGLRQRIALVAQDTYLFNDTLEANVRLARPDASAEQIALALRRAALADFVAGLPDGLATRVGERGVQLSGGQRQRIAIARAFLKDAPLLVLDEATSHLDTISEQAVRSALAELMVDRTTIVVAHRLSTIRAADLILVLRDGRVVESGTHASLLARRGVYARLVDQQMASVAVRA